MSYYPIVDAIAARLHREGWSMGDVAVKYPDGWVWVVSGQRSGQWIGVEGPSQTAAWKSFANVARRNVE